MNVTFYYDYGSPASYLAWTQLPDLCARYDAKLDYRPILLGGLFKTVGTRSPADVESKKRWFFEDMQRYADLYGVDYQQNPYFIINTLPLMRGALWAANEGCLEGYNRTMFEACWAHARNLNHPAEIMAVLKEGGFDADAVASAIQTDEIKQALIQATQAAADSGVFGVPIMVVAGELHFGQDRLDWIEQALAEAQAARY
ncbi:MAG: 2-hydroxychromene-2-carboxylate isomerase [Alphaproteobacteria bacterium]|nr:2-hydroxychromene-2-carboxylate isomerase [Alphaproteobacteria bacterium]